MLRSLNEIEQTVRKAVRGGGYAWGLADEAGKAVRAMHQRGENGVYVLVRGLGQFDSDPLHAHSPQFLSNELSAPSGLLDPIVTGPTICDALLSGLLESITAVEVAWPLLIAGYLAVPAGDPDQSVTVSWDGAVIEISESGYTISGTRAARYESRVSKLTCSRFTLKDVPHPERLRTCHVPVDDDDWKRLEVWARRTYVEATDASRLSGAGAGLQDND